ncbi:MAG TPA: trimethylamine methyltransferase family protein [Anaerolineales bacterium]|jgi:trimethylamine--corrinoid protein Co-methyltransferase
MIRFATLLTEEQVAQIHEASLEILEEVGLLVRNEKARARFEQHGCPVDLETQIVRFPRRVVEELRAAFPSSFTFHGRDPRFDRTIPEDGPIIITGSSAPNIVDPVAGYERRATSDDIARIAFLINELPGYDVFSISTLADDAPEGQFTLSRLYPAVKNCLKPVRSNAPNQDDADQLLKLGALIAGSEEAYRAHPFITTHFCPVVSPLTMDFDSTELLMFFAGLGLPVYPSIVPNAGLTSPLTLVGTLAQGNAEFLAAGVLMQMVREGTPLIYSTLPTVGDMRSGAYASGGIECGILHMAFAQMARFYNVPCGGYIGLTNSKINDAQAGYETGMSTVAGLLAGVNMFNMGGLLDALMAFDFAKAVIDDEIAQMMKRIKRGLEFSQDNLALDLIAEMGPAGMFMDSWHTLERMKTAAFLPTIADRETRDVWMRNGSLDAGGRAMRRVQEILSRDNPAVFSSEVDARIRAEFEGLVAGDVTLPDGWKPVVVEQRVRTRRMR